MPRVSEGETFSLRLTEEMGLRIANHRERLRGWNVPAPDRSATVRHLLELAFAVYEQLERGPWPLKDLPSRETLLDWMEAGRELRSLSPAEQRRFERLMAQTRSARRRKGDD